MAELYGRNYTREELMKKTGDTAQIGGIRRAAYTEGWAKGVDVIEVNTGPLKFNVIPSRCMDIANSEYKCCPFGYMTKSGIRGPEHFVENEGKGFLDNFFGGLLTTSGLMNIGSPSVSDGRAYGLHGEISNVPAEDVCAREYWQGDDLVMELSGRARHSRFYAEDLVLHRTIKTKLGSSSIQLTDVLENCDFKRMPLLFLYHINFGFPFVDADSRLVAPETEKIVPRFPEMEKGLATAAGFQQPVDGQEEECFHYYFKDDEVKISLRNPNLGEKGMSVYLKYNRGQFPIFTQWKMMRSREYVCGFNPSTNLLGGRDSVLKNEQVRYLEPLERAEFNIEIGVEEG